ncbi:MAG: hypothetical protein KAG61_10530 [Bacteriovoracaceae bacterium]|nr:hypothetical protein [Bacteriovoracaceae bacterium]
MKNILILLVIVLMAVSCASTPKEEKKGDLLSEIENIDFMPKKAVPYVARADAFKGEISRYDSISNESVNRLPQPKLEKMEDPKDPINSGISLCYRGMYQRAFKVFDNAYERYKTHPGYWNQVGSCYLIKKDYRKALLYYNKALGVQSKYAPAINNFGVLYLRQGKDQLAIEAFKKASKINSFSLTPMFNLAHLYLKYGALNKAYNILHVLYKKNKNDVDVLSALGSYNLMLGNAKNAVGFFKKIDESHLKRADIALNYAYALKKIGNTGDAKNIIKNLRTKDLEGYQNYYLSVKKYVEK